MKKIFLALVFCVVGVNSAMGALCKEIPMTNNTENCIVPAGYDDPIGTDLCIDWLDAGCVAMLNDGKGSWNSGLGFNCNGATQNAHVNDHDGIAGCQCYKNMNGARQAGYVYACTCTSNDDCANIGTAHDNNKYTCVNNICQACSSTGTDGYVSCPDGSYQCAKGYYGTPTSGTSGCIKCPDLNGIEATTDSNGATSITQCCIPKDSEFSEACGSGLYTQKCCWAL